MRVQVCDKVALLAPERRHAAGSHPPVDVHHREGVNKGLVPAREEPADKVGTVGRPHSGEAKDL